MKQSSCWRRGQIAVFVTAIVISTLLVATGSAQEATPVASGETSLARCDGGSMGSHAQLARQGTIFIARVVDVVLIRREKESRLNDPNDPFPLIIYTVDVERSLGDDVSGRVNISFYDPRLSLTRKKTSGPLTIGERYLFFAGVLSSRGAYPVDLEYGFLPVRDDQHAAELVAEFIPLIQQAEQRERIVQAELAEAAWAKQGTLTSATITPSHGDAGSEVTISGSGFSPAEVLLIWDDGSAEQIEARDDGQFEVTTTVPRGLGSGRHTIEICGLGLDREVVTFFVD